MIKKILIVNRGEIAVRIIRTLKEMRIKSVAIFSAADRSSLHIKLADEAYYVGPAEAAFSYLNQEKILNVLMRSKADAVHPGYGLLSENPEFAKKVIDLGKIFIGPTPNAIEEMGNKTTARNLMIKNDVPVIPGSDYTTDIDKLKKFADEIGYPVMIKAAFGGGGRGMRKVDEPEKFVSLATAAMREAKACFNQDEIFVEKYIVNPRHIEIQILRDNFGNCVFLGERDCSIQRRHQKLIEEAPSPFINNKFRQKIGNAAIKAANAANYTGAGTVEFLVNKDSDFFFMEMNTRIQVEHPITEMITQKDLIKEQILIADNKELNYSQDDIHIKGHAIECRINAEDVDNNFLPAPGKIGQLIMPGGLGIRIDSSVFAGYEIPKYYDSMILKIIAYGKTRDEAILKMQRALQETFISGIKTTLKFHLKVLHNNFFISGVYDTHFIDENYLEEGYSDKHKERAAALAAALNLFAKNFEENISVQPKLKQNENSNKWKIASKMERIL